jgi:hypothetical protein
MELYFKLSVLVFSSLLCGAQATDMTNAPALTNPPAASGTNFESFRLVAERNIFNQSRSPRSARRSNTPARVAPKVQALSLVGTMSFAKGNFAFFDGTSPDYKKPVKAGDKIAEYEVKEVTASSVKVANEKQEFELKVGQQLRREDEGEWQIASGAQKVTASEAGAESAKSSGGDISEEEAVRRLMEKRAKELNP